jgi:pyruvate,orthophosphate dikinase
MILSRSKEDRDSALEKLLPHQKDDFKKIFNVMSGLPVTVDYLILLYMNFYQKQIKI